MKAVAAVLIALLLVTTPVEAGIGSALRKTGKGLAVAAVVTVVAAAMVCFAVSSGTCVGRK